MHARGGRSASVLLAALLVAACSSTPAASPSPTGQLSSGSTRSPLERALDGINEDGTWSAQTALDVFAAAFGPLPDVAAPPADTSYHSGTAALQMVEARWSELTD